MQEIKNGRDKNSTTIAVNKATKSRLDDNRAPGQCYNGFICQLIDLWEHVKRKDFQTPSDL